MRMYVFTDLDDSLFQTLRKCGVPAECTAANAAQCSLAGAAWSRQGEPLSFMTPRQQRLLEFLNKGAAVVPVTARNLDAFQRVRLPFAHGAVLNYGGTVLLPDGSEDMDWRAHTRSILAPWRQPLEAMAARLTRWAEHEGLAARTRVIGADDCAFYVVIKNVNPEQDVLTPMRTAGTAMLDAPAQWFVHHNDNNLAFIPAVLNKVHAVRHMIDTHIAPQGEDFLTIGMGDSLADLDFMRACDYALVPSGSQIQKVCIHE